MNKEHLTPEEQEVDCLHPDNEETVGGNCSDPDKEEPAEANCIRPDAKADCISPQEAELENRLLRLHAEFDNFRKRTARERLEQATLAEAELLAHLLPVLDNFDRALANLPQDADVSWAEGVQLVYKQLLDVLGQQGLERINCQQPFDPNIHEAVMREICDDDEAEGTILQELQPGYLYQGKLLRPSMVKVATKG